MTDEPEDPPSRPRLVNINDADNRAAHEQALADMDLGRVDPLQSQAAARYAEIHKWEFKFNRTRKVWMVWDEDVWREDERGRATLAMQNLAEAMRRLDPRNRRSLGNASFTRGSMALLEVMPSMQAIEEDFDSDAHFVGVPGGHVDLTTGTLHPADPKKMISMQCTKTPKQGEPVKWITFLEQAHKGQENAIPWLQKLAGEAIIGRQTSHHFAFFFGSGGNGKGVYSRVLTQLLGNYVVTAMPGTFTRSERSYRGHLQNLAVLEGKRLVLSAEPDEDEKWDMGRVKEWTGGGYVSANRMYSTTREFMPKGLLLLEANHNLKIEQVNNAVARRLNYLHWPHKFSGEGFRHIEIGDLDLQLVEEEGEEILGWIFEGARKVLEEGLGTCPAVTEASAEYMREQDRWQRFIDECLEPEENAQPGVDLQDLTLIYNEWARANEESTAKYIGSKLKQKGLIVTKTKARNYVRQHTLSEDGMTFMTQILSRRLRNRELSHGEALRWEDVLRGWRLRGAEGDYLDELLGGDT